MKPLVIIGSGLAGFNLVKEIRKIAADMPLLMLTADDGNIYSKPMLSTGFSKGKNADDLVMFDADQVREKFAITYKTDVRVTVINTETQQVCYQKNGADVEVEYSALVLALGANVLSPKLSGDGADAVLSVNDLMDYRALRATIAELSAQKSAESIRIAILGGGLIGCEFAYDLREGGYCVSLIEPAGRLLPNLVPETASAALSSALLTQGCDIVYGHFATAVHQEAEGLQLELANGERIAADVVISAIGLRPRIQLAKEADIATDLGITVDASMRTSAKHVYAVGDCAQIEGLFLPYVMPLMGSARALAKTLTQEITDKWKNAIAVSYGVIPVNVKTPCCPISVCVPANGAEGQWESETLEGDYTPADTKTFFVNSVGQRLGYALTGECVKEKLTLNKQMPAVLNTKS